MDPHPTDQPSPTPATQPRTGVRAPLDPVARAGRRRDRARGALAGALAATLTLATVVLLREATEIVSVLDALAEVVLSTMPLGLFSALLRIFGTDAKAWLLAGELVGLVVVGALLGKGFAGATAGSRRVQWSRGVILGLSVWAVLAVFLVWAAGIRTAGALTGIRIVWALLCVGGAAAVFAGALPAALAALRRLDRAPGTAPAGEPDLGRRRLLTRAGLGAVALAGLAVLGREVGRVRSGEAVAEGEPGRVPEPITPTDEFYVISKNFVDPTGDGGGDWRLRVDGAVGAPLELTMADLRALAGPDFAATLTCISNEVGGPLISTAVWSGAPLAAVLERAGVGAGVVDVVFHGRDGYTDTIPIQKAMEPTTALVWGMNGAPLNATHGAPLRGIVPGRYGIKNVKWLERISLSEADELGYWQRRDWTEEAVVKTSSRVDAPAPRGIVAADAAELAGIAFAGDRGIGRVEVSTDDGETWAEATIAARPSPLSWVIWRRAWSPAPGTYRVVVRATDGTGELQTAERAPTLPDGASGWHEVTVGVA